MELFKGNITSFQSLFPFPSHFRLVARTSQLEAYFN